MAQEKAPTRAQKIAAASSGLKITKSKRKPVVADNDANPGVEQVEAGSVQPEIPSEDVIKPPVTNNVTSLVSRTVPPILAASYQSLLERRTPVVARVKAAIATIERSYAENDKDNREARSERYELADQTLDYLIDMFDHNGFSNPGDRLVMSWLMFGLLKPIGHRTDEVCDLIEKTFFQRKQMLSEKGLGWEIKRRREKQAKRLEDQNNAA